MEAQGLDVNQLAKTAGVYTKQMALYLAVCLAGLAAIDWLAGWRTLFQFADSLFIGGALVMTVGAMSNLGQLSSTRDFKQTMARSVSTTSLGERVAQQEQDDAASFSFASLSIGCGIALVVLSVLTHQFI